MRITNIDTLSALIDRLVTERIKYFFFEKDNLTEKVDHQKIVIDNIRNKIAELFLEVYDNGKYKYLQEHRTFNASNIVENIDQLVTNDIHIGESDRARLNIAMLEEKRLRKSNEGRSFNKNIIDEQLSELTDKDE